MNDIDEKLALIAQADHPGLHGMEDAVLARLAGSRTSVRSGLGIATLAAAGAVVLGATVGGTAPTPATAASLDPIGAASELAPSTLLVGR
ncbi:hypothetical protein [Sphingomonas sp.]|uniref:hypothetical protein n=1 Tax=Sphingomonas sp. TaxID=28214 RepID=UPI00258E554E|nr:hypothetical protein [Sphingomonas sp.]